MDKIYVRVGEPGFARVSHSPRSTGIRVTIATLIKGMAKRGAQS